MIPRRDPETVPTTTGIQLHRRRRPDQYGTERGRMDLARPRPLVTRGTGQSMTQAEAERRLVRR